MVRLITILISRWFLTYEVDCNSGAKFNQSAPIKHVRSSYELFRAVKNLSKNDASKEYTSKSKRCPEARQTTTGWWTPRTTSEDKLFYSGRILDNEEDDLSCFGFFIPKLNSNSNFW
jgi:hypothetical protein